MTTDTARLLCPRCGTPTLGAWCLAHGDADPVRPPEPRERRQGELAEHSLARLIANARGERTR